MPISNVNIGPNEKPSPIKLVKRDQFPHLDHNQIEEQIRVRQELAKQMVGWLYPSVLADEIDELAQWRDDPSGAKRKIEQNTEHGRIIEL